MTNKEYTGEKEHEVPHVVQSTQTLIKACVGASIFAGIILSVAILPAEYDIDPTGLGARLGLTKLANAFAPVKTDQPAGQYHEDKVSITVPAGKGLEYKLNVLKNESFTYSWKTNAEGLYFDFHGEPKGDTTGYFQTYTASTSNAAQGTLTAPFEGTHGWYWENKGAKDVVVSLMTEGNYTLVDKK
jgi:hypothetical protein